MILPASPDGYPIAEVGPWARDKLTILEQYIKISRHARAKYTRRTEATYVDRFCGPGLSRIRGTDEYLPGSPVVAFDAAQESGVPFNRLFISDSDANNVDAARGRLEDKGAIVTAVAKAAEVAIDDVARQLNPHGLHFALLDPFNLFDLPFVIIEKLLTSFKHIDLMVLLSTGDLQRNFRKDYLSSSNATLDRFAPRWRENVRTDDADDETVRQRIVDYWFSLLTAQNVPPSTKMHRAKNSMNVTMYWLVFASRADIANKVWAAAQNYIRQPTLPGL